MLTSDMTASRLAPRAFAGAFEYHRSLSLAVGAGALDSTTADVVALLDGFLDNCRELGSHLGLGVDAGAEEVVRAGFGRWGKDLLERLRGDFALLVWDRRQRRGLLACDQLGARTIFMHTRGSHLCFASGLQSLIGLLEQHPVPDRLALVEYLALRPLARWRTMYEGIVQLPPAHAVVLSSDTARPFRYWAPVYAGTSPGRLEEAAERLEQAISLGVRRRLGQDGATGIAMSGGLDSTTVAALAHQEAPDSVSAYAITMPAFPEHDETGYVADMARHCGLAVRTFPAPPTGMAAAGVRSLATLGLPALTTTDFLRQPLMAAARADGATIMLSGHGGDEVFGVRTELLADLLRAGRLLAVIDEGRCYPGSGEFVRRRDVAWPWLGFAYRSLRPHLVDEFSLRLAGPVRLAPHWLRPDAARLLFDGRPHATWKRIDGPRWWARLVDLLTRNHARVGLFEEERRTGLQAGLEQRHPLLDFDLVNVALRLVPEQTFDAGRDRPHLRAVTQGLLPDSVRLRRTKTNFVPVAMTAMLRDVPLIRAVLTDPRAEIRSVADPLAVEALLDGRHPGGRMNQWWMDSVWRLFMAECWLQGQSDRAHTLRLLERLDATVPPQGREAIGSL